MDEEPTASLSTGRGLNPSRLLHDNAAHILSRLLGDISGGLEREGDTIGPYRLMDMLGEGGFGIVWQAEQAEPVRRDVALKVIKSGMDTVQVLSRFNQERQALASLDHPGIATLLNANVTGDGRPWFAMELVRGGPLTAWCEAHAAPLALRLRMFIQVCHAVQHAHQKGILHRDLKPSNILITEIDGQPLPKVIDFGIAKAIHASAQDQLTLLTQADQVLGTPLYMAPEQIEGGKELDARADIYALGVILYELLTGTPPFAAKAFQAGDAAALKRLILETVPERPSTRLRQRTASPSQPGLPADLDWITLRALEKARERRYSSAQELAADLQRHLDDQRVLARPPGLLYTTRRWIKRHRTGCTAGAAGCVLSAMVFGVSLSWQNTAGSHAGPITLAAGGTFTNSLGMKFVPVPGTSVLFCIHETRFQDFTAYAADVPGAVSNWNDEISPAYDLPLKQRTNYPVARVNWEESQAFCQWLSHKEGRTYRLPTDQEWSRAAGIGDDEQWTADTTPKTVFKNTTDYPWGTAWPPPPGAGNYSDEAWKRRARPSAPEPWLQGYDDGFALTAPVMSFKPNKFGLYDMGGNVAEWVYDWADKTRKERVLRGGFWGSFPGEDFKTFLLSSARLLREYSPRIKNPYYGFRCVLETKLSVLHP